MKNAINALFSCRGQFRKVEQRDRINDMFFIHEYYVKQGSEKGNKIIEILNEIVESYVEVSINFSTDSYYITPVKDGFNVKSAIPQVLCDSIKLIATDVKAQIEQQEKDRVMKEELNNEKTREIYEALNEFIC